MFLHHDDVAMFAKAILIHRLTPAQVDLIDRLAESGGIPVDGLGYPDLIAHRELEKLGLAEIRVEHRKNSRLVITDQGCQVRAAGYMSRKPVARLTQPQTEALRFLAARPRHFNEIPASMKDIVRRLRLQGWARSEADDKGLFWSGITREGLELLKLIDY